MPHKDADPSQNHPILVYLPRLVLMIASRLCSAKKCRFRSCCTCIILYVMKSFPAIISFYAGKEKSKNLVLPFSDISEGFNKLPSVARQNCQYCYTNGGQNPTIFKGHDHRGQNPTWESTGADKTPPLLSAIPLTKHFISYWHTSNFHAMIT